MTTAATTYSDDGRGRFVIEKDPNSVLDYTFNWTEWLTDIGDTMQSCETLLGASASIALMSSDAHDGLHTVWLTGGVRRRLDRVISRIHTAAGRVEDRSIYVKVKER